MIKNQKKQEEICNLLPYLLVIIHLIYINYMNYYYNIIIHL